MVISPSRTFVFHINRQQDVQESKQNKTKEKKNVNAQKYKPSDLPVIFTSLT